MIIVAVVEHLSRWLIKEATASQKANVAMTLFYENVIADLGSSTTLLSNQGVTFTSGAWRKAIRNTEHNARITTSYSTESSGRAVRIIQTIKRALASCFNETKNEFDDVLQEIVSGYNIRAANYELSLYKLMYCITPTPVRNHVKARSEICNVMENIVDVVNGDVWSDLIV